MPLLSLTKTILSTFAQQWKGYWRVRRWLQLRTFFVLRMGFNVRSDVTQEIHASGVLWGLFRAAGRQVIFAILVAIALQFTSHWLETNFTTLNVPSPDDGAYSTFLTMVASVAGVFIGLYYAAITTIAASSYAKLPSGVRALLTAERQGGTYIRYLAFLACLCTVLLAIRLIGFKPLPLAVPLIAVFACIGIVAFVKLGQRVFVFFNPVTLSGYVVEDIVKCVKGVADGGYRWKDPSFQKHGHVRAKAELETMAALVSLCKQPDESRKDSLSGLCLEMSRLFLEYLKKKPRIPTASQWYETAIEFVDFYRSDESTVLLAHHTGSLPSPSQARNLFWFEENVERLISDAILYYYESGDEDNLGDVGALLPTIVEALCKSGEAKRASKLIDSVVTLFNQQYMKPTLALPGSDGLRLRLIASELVGRAMIQLVLGVRSFAVDMTAEFLKTTVKTATLFHTDGPYKFGTPCAILSQLEELNAQLLVEPRIEGRRITEGWFIEEHIRQALSRCIAECVETLYIDAPSIAQLAISCLPVTRFPWEMASIVRSETEMLSKLLVHLPAMCAAHAKLVGDGRIQGLKWSTIDETVFAQKMKAAAVQNSIASARLAPLLSRLSRPKYLPDYAGLFLHDSGEAIIEALLTGEDDVFFELFPPYFDGCIALVVGAIANQEQLKRAPEYEVGVALAPLSELINISGYAILMSEARQVATAKDAVAAQWDGFLQSGEHQDQLLIFLATCVPMFDDVTFPQHRMQVRFEWSQKVVHALSKLLKVDLGYGAYGQDEDEEIQHPSALVRAVAGAVAVGTLQYAGGDIFRATYLTKYPQIPAVAGWRNLAGVLKAEQRST